MTRRAPAGLAVCLTLVCTLIGTLIGTAGEAHAQFGWSFRLGPWQSSYYFGRSAPTYYTGYSPSYTSYYAGYTPSYTYTASYAPAYTASYYAPSCVGCASPCVACAAPCPCQPCAPCAVGCAPATVTAGTAGAVTGPPAGAPPMAQHGMAQHGAPPPGQRACRKCTIDDAQVYSGPQGLLYIDGERGFVQMEWGGRLRYAELAFSRQDDEFRYYEQLPPPGEEPIARPPVWSVTLRPCPECKHAIWHNYDQAGARGWTKVQSAEVRCVTPLAPAGTPPNTPPNTEERRRPPYRQDDGFELERREKQSDNGRDSGWTIVPQRSSERREGNVAWVSAESDPLPALSETLSDAPTTRRSKAARQRLAGDRESTLRVSRAERLRD